MAYKLNRRPLKQIIKAQIDAAEAALQVEMKAFGVDWSKFYLEVVDDWANKPQFTERVTLQANVLKLYVTPVDNEEGQAFIWVNNGTGKGGVVGVPYPIKPRKPGGKLRFQTGYSARTGTGGQYGVGSGRASGDIVYSDGVMHPGIEPRRFDVRFADENRKEFARRMNVAIRRGVSTVKS